MKDYLIMRSILAIGLLCMGSILVVYNPPAPAKPAKGPFKYSKYPDFPYASNDQYGKPITVVGCGPLGCTFKKKDEGYVAVQWFLSWDQMKRELPDVYECLGPVNQ